MKSEHRHELKTNELADWIAHLPQWTRENQRMIIYVSIVIIVAIASYIWHRYEKDIVSVRRTSQLTNLVTQIPQGKLRILEAQARGLDIAYMLIQNADELNNTAEQIKDNQMSALALIKRAEALRTELHYRLGTVSEQDIISQIALARESYNKAIAKAPANPSLMAMAKFGLGLCEEEVGNFEQAKQIYNEVATNADFAGTVPAVQAKRRLEKADDYRQKVTFRPAPKPAPMEIIQPGLDLAPLDTGVPLEVPEDLLVPELQLQRPQADETPNLVPGQ
jgi:tetratricopeptide (TPR) repeat protein